MLHAEPSMPSHRLSLQVSRQQAVGRLAGMWMRSASLRLVQPRDWILRKNRAMWTIGRWSETTGLRGIPVAFSAWGGSRSLTRSGELDREDSS